MMKKRLVVATVMAALSTGSAAYANDFVNGGFELGDTSGWTTYGGTWTGSPLAPIDPSVYMPGGANYDPLASPQISVMASGIDSNAGGTNAVFDGINSVRVNNAANDSSVSVITQSVTNYSGSYINLAWSAVLEGSHGETDSDHFVIRVFDNTAGREVALVSYSSASSSSVFTNNSGIYYSGWRGESIRVTSGHDYTVTMLVADCPYGGHWGYVYLDSFGIAPLSGIPINVFIPPGPSTEDTQLSLNSSASALKNIFNLQSGVMTSGLGYDCSLFNEHGVCVSGGGRYTNANSAANSSGALLIAAYRVNDNLRVGGYLDEDLHNRTPSGINLSNNGPLGGLFAVWQQNASADSWGGRQTPNGQGWGARASIAYGDKDVTVTRSAMSTSEAGVGKASLTSNAAQFEVNYGKLVNDKVLFTPYVGIRYGKINRDSYTESTTSDVTAPLSYASLAQEQTTALVGLRAFTQLTPKVSSYASLGLEQDLNYKGGRYSATGVTGLEDFNFNNDVTRARPVASIGASYATKDKQRINLDFFYKKETFSEDNIYSAMATYTVGF